MSEQQKQIAKLTGVIVEHQGHFGVMSTEDRQWVIQNTVAAIGIFAEAVRNRGHQITVKLLKLITTLTVSGFKKFAAAKKFVVDTSDDAELKISYLGDDFDKYFGVLVEEDVEATIINVHNLNQNSLDPEIMAELTTERRVIKLGHFYEALRQLTMGVVIAYIIGNDGLGKDSCWFFS